MMKDAIAEEYVRLALAIGQHLPNYIDAYFGPPEFKTRAEADGKLPLPDLVRRAGALAEAVSADAALDAQRRDFLSRHIRAMHTSLRLLGGEKLTLADEADLVYDIRPQRVDEAELERAQQELDELLPTGGSLYERLSKRRQALTISVEKTKELLPVIEGRLREETRQRFPLPADESVKFEFVSGHPWFAYNWYLGGGRSRIEINNDLPMQVTRLVATIAHECYPGHHTELSIKDERLLRAQGRLEHSVVILNSPGCVVAEGIATSALSVLLPDEALTAWYAQELLPQAGLDPELVRGWSDIARIIKVLDGAGDNAAFMLHDDGVEAADFVRYMQKYGLYTEQEARKRLDFISHPVDRAYIFTYSAGRQLLEALFEQKGDVTHWFTRLLSEPVTPSQIRAWIAAERHPAA